MNDFLISDDINAAVQQQVPSGGSPSSGSKPVVRPFIGKFFDKLTEAVGATRELLSDGDLRRRAVPFVLTEGGKALQELQKGLTRNAAALGRHLQQSSAGQFSAVISRLLERAATQQYRSRVIRYDRPVNLWIGQRMIRDMPQEARSRLWFVLVEHAQILQQLGPISSKIVLQSRSQGGVDDRSKAVDQNSNGVNVSNPPASSTGLVQEEGEQFPEQQTVSSNQQIQRHAVSDNDLLGLDDCNPTTQNNMPDVRLQHQNTSPELAQDPVTALEQLLNLDSNNQQAMDPAQLQNGTGNNSTTSVTPNNAQGNKVMVPEQQGSGIVARNEQIGLEANSKPAAGTSLHVRSSPATPVSRFHEAQGSSTLSPTSRSQTAGSPASFSRSSAEQNALFGRSKTQGNPYSDPNASAAPNASVTESDWELLDAGPSNELGGTASRRVSQTGAHSCLQRLQDLLDESRAAQQGSSEVSVAPNAELLTQLLSEMMSVPWEEGKGLVCHVPPDCRYLTLNEMTAGQEEVDDVIMRDIHRTFPEHPFFSGSAGQMSLFRLLKAYSLHDLEVGYCQGMAFAAGVMLMYLPEEPAFRLYCQVMGDEGANLRRLYLPGLQPLKDELARFERLLSFTQPALHAHLMAFGIPPVLYVSQWIMTVYASPFPPSFCAQLIDIMLQDGHDAIMMHVALTIMDLLAEQLLSMSDFEQLLTSIKVLPMEWDEDKLDQVVAQAVDRSWQLALQADQQCDMVQETNDDLLGLGQEPSSSHITDAFDVDSLLPTIDKIDDVLLHSVNSTQTHSNALHVTQQSSTWPHGDHEQGTLGADDLQLDSHIAQMVQDLQLKLHT